jgi:PPOX class probable F420-dependent enzyme
LLWSLGYPYLTSGKRSLPIPSLRIERDRHSRSLAAVERLDCTFDFPRMAPSVARTAQALGGLSSVISVVVAGFMRPIRRVTTTFEPTVKGPSPRTDTMLSCESGKQVSTPLVAKTRTMALEVLASQPRAASMAATYGGSLGRRVLPVVRQDHAEVDEARLSSARVARLATTDPDRRPQLVPVVFALEGDTLYSAVDRKPKRSRTLQRIENARTRPDVAILDHYEEDWGRLWWIRLRGRARVLDEARSESTPSSC